MSFLEERKRQDLNAAVVKIRNLASKGTIALYAHEADALYAELCRLANYATLLGEPSPAEVSGIFTREEAEAIALERYGELRETIAGGRYPPGTPQRVVEAVLEDLGQRKGIGDELASIEPDIMESIRGELTDRVYVAMGLVAS